MAVSYDDIHRNVFFWIEQAIRYFTDVRGAPPVFFDVGAHEGLFSRSFAPRCAEVVAFEPDEVNVTRLRASLEGSFRCRIVPLALGEESAQMALHRYDDSSFNSLYSRNESTRAHYNLTSLGSYEVPVCPLDELADDFLLPQIVKIDTEGAELFVLRGAVKTLSRARPVIVVEYSMENTEAAGYRREEVLHFLQDLSFEVFGLLKNIDTRLYSGAMLTERKIWNLLAVPGEYSKEFLSAVDARRVQD